MWIETTFGLSHICWFYFFTSKIIPRKLMLFKKGGVDVAVTIGVGFPP